MTACSGDPAAVEAASDRMVGVWARVNADDGSIDWGVCERTRPVYLETTRLPGRAWPGDFYAERDDDGDLWVASGAAAQHNASSTRFFASLDRVRMDAWGQSYHVTFADRDVDGETRDEMTVTWRPNPERVNVYVRCG